MSLAERMKVLKEKEEQWKSKGKGAANDSVQFTVAGRMARRGKTMRVFIQCGLTVKQTLSYIFKNKNFSVMFHQVLYQIQERRSHLLVASRSLMPHL